MVQSKRRARALIHLHISSISRVYVEREAVGFSVIKSLIFLLEPQPQTQMQRLIIDSSPCKHGFDPFPFPEGDICRSVSSYSNTFMMLVVLEIQRIDAILKAMTAVDKQYPEVLRDSSKTKQKDTRNSQ